MPSTMPYGYHAPTMHQTPTAFHDEYPYPAYHPPAAPPHRPSRTEYQWFEFYMRGRREFPPWPDFCKDLCLRFDLASYDKP